MVICVRIAGRDCDNDLCPHSAPHPHGDDCESRLCEYLLHWRGVKGPDRRAECIPDPRLSASLHTAVDVDSAVADARAAVTEPEIAKVGQWCEQIGETKGVDKLNAVREDET